MTGGGGGICLLTLSVRGDRSGGRPAEITSEERRYRRPNEQRGITQHKVVLLFQSNQKNKASFDWNPNFPLFSFN